MNDSLLNFLTRFPPPATTAELWGEINSMRQFGCSPCPDLPATWEQLDVELRALAVAGLVVDDKGQWRLTPRKVERKAEATLF